MRRAGRAGLTLTELVVVAAVTAAAAAILLPGVQLAREAAFRTRCANNLKQIGLACHGFEAQFGFFPSSVNKTGPERSWAGQVLPWIEQGTVAALYDFTRPWYDTANALPIRHQIPTYYCPSTPVWPRAVSGKIKLGSGTGSVTFPFKKAAATDYIVLWRVRQESYDAGLVDELGDGILVQDAFPRVVDILDGTSNTLLVTENSGRPDLWVGRRCTPEELKDGDAPYISRHNDTNFWGADPATGDRPGPLAVNVTNDNSPYSFHPAGVNCVMGDLSVRMVSYTTTTRAFARLVTRAGGEIVDWADY